MVNAKIAARMLGRILGLGLFGAVMGVFLGAIEGGFFGALCATLLRAFDPNNPPMPFGEYPVLGGMFGAGFGVTSGAIAGFLAGAIVAAFQKPDMRTDILARLICRGAFYGSFLCATAGALSGTALQVIGNLVVGRKEIWAGAFDLGGGFCLLSVAGFSLGLLVGALYYGLSKGRVVFPGELRVTYPHQLERTTH